jgi:hypothetical protein
MPLTPAIVSRNRVGEKGLLLVANLERSRTAAQTKTAKKPVKSSKN